MSKVYHDKGFPKTMVKASERRFPDDFVEVAEVASEELGEIYALTNHIDQDWTLNEEVSKATEGPVRSTSMGDVVVLADGSVHLCEAVGWREVGNIKDAPLTFTSGGLKFSFLPAGGQHAKQE
jgi:hypothetical protein